VGVPKTIRHRAKKNETTWLFAWLTVSTRLAFGPLFTCKNWRNFNTSCRVNLSLDKGYPAREADMKAVGWKTPIRLTETLTLTRQQPLSISSISKLKKKITALNCLSTAVLLVSICMCCYHVKSIKLPFHLKKNTPFELPARTLISLRIDRISLCHHT